MAKVNIELSEFECDILICIFTSLSESLDTGYYPVEKFALSFVIDELSSAEVVNDENRE